MGVGVGGAREHAGTGCAYRRNGSPYLPHISPISAPYLADSEEESDLVIARYNEGMDEVLAMGELDVANVTH